MKNYLTPDGFRKLRDELSALMHDERPKVVEAVSVAAAMGDRSENAEYIYGKRRLREIDSRIRFLGNRLEDVEIIDPTTVATDQVRFGVCVELEDEDGKILNFQILGQDEIDTSQGRITYSSPIGRALLGKKVNDWVTVSTPGGAKEYLVKKISRP